MENPSEGAKQGGSRRGSKSLIAIIIALVLIAAGAYAYSKGYIGTSRGATVATVNGAEIKEKEVTMRFNQLRPTYQSQGVNLEDEAVVLDIKKKIIDEIVNEELVLQHATSKGVTASDEEVETAYSQIQAGFENETAFDAELKENSLTKSELKNNLKRELVIQKYIEAFATEQNITATEDEITKLYNDLSKGQENVPALADVRVQIEQEVKRQKLAEKIVLLVAELKQQANIQILI